MQPRLSRNATCATCNQTRPVYSYVYIDDGSEEDVPGLNARACWRANLEAYLFLVHALVKAHLKKQINAAEYSTLWMGRSERTIQSKIRGVFYIFIFFKIIFYEIYF